MADPKQQQSEPKAAETTKPKKSAQQGDAKADPTPGESIEGEGSPGLSILGGGGHA